MKTKAFSKEGQTQEKYEATTWIQTKMEELRIQIDQSEEAVEALRGWGKKKRRTSAAAKRLEELERLNERRKWHVDRLELVMRLLDNGSLPVEKVRNLQEDVTYFVESNTVSTQFACLGSTLIPVLGRGL